MDPNEVYSNLISAWHQLRDAQNNGEPAPSAAWRLLDAVELLDTWLRKGGFLPTPWAQPVDYDPDSPSGRIAEHTGNKDFL